MGLALAAKSGKIDLKKTPKEKRQYFTKAVEVSQDNVKEIIAMYVKGTPKYDWIDLYAFYVRPMT